MFDTLIVIPLMESLKFLSGVIGSYGIAIILLTIFIRLITLPLTLQQIRSSKAMQELQPKLQELQRKYGKDKEKLSQEQMKLYREAGVNPLAGCLPMLVQLPIWIGLYQALRNLATAGLLQEGFLWIPSLAQPTSLEWFWPPSNWVWPDVAAYLVLPILTVVSQIVVQKMMTSPTTDPQQSAMNQTMLMMSFMFGFFAMQVPSGLALYWVTSNLLSLIQQYFVSGWGSLRPPKQAEAPRGAKAASKREKRDARRKKKRRG
ncbi:MAG TPA: YidC/Oxa1 family membrane protein insertase [Anaerolineae bacterium]|nr:YidC/Oxa1 family membrane protein insertase [Anaerolineae bacterium]